MKHKLLLAAALLLLLSSASALAPRKKFLRRSSTAGLARSLLSHSNRYVAGIRSQWKKQPVRVAGGYKRCAPFVVVSTTADVAKTTSAASPYVGYLAIKVRYKETMVCKTPKLAMRAPLMRNREFTLEPAYEFRQGKWVPSSGL